MDHRRVVAELQTLIPFVDQTTYYSKLNPTMWHIDFFNTSTNLNAIYTSKFGAASFSTATSQIKYNINSNILGIKYITRKGPEYNPFIMVDYFPCLLQIEIGQTSCFFIPKVKRLQGNTSVTFLTLPLFSIVPYVIYHNWRGKSVLRIWNVINNCKPKMDWGQSM